MRKILFGAGGAGIRALHQIGKERVLAFCDNYKAGQTVDGIAIIDIAGLLDIMQKEKCEVIICVAEPGIACGIARQLFENGIECELCEECKEIWKWDLMHIVDEDVVYLSDTVCSQLRRKMWYPLYSQMLDKYKEEFKDKNIDFWIYLEDKVETAYWAVKLKVVDAAHIFAFGTAGGIDDIVIPVPDYTYNELLGWVESDIEKDEYDVGGVKYEECAAECKVSAGLPWKKEKAFWIGNLNNHSSREHLYQLGEKYPDDLEIKSYDWGRKSGFIPMTEWYQYKYLIDASGYGGWTDRLKMLFLLGRPVFVNERSQKEFWMAYGLEEGKHYISVKEDFSDLLEKKRDLDMNPKKYQKIVTAMQLYAEKFLTKEFALEYLKAVILKYGAKKKAG